jgi:hypothetical protein
MMHYYLLSAGTLGFIHIAFHSHGRALLNNIGQQRKQPGGRLLVIQTPNFRFRKCWPDGLPPHDQVNAITLTPSLSGKPILTHDISCCLNMGGAIQN